MSILKVDSIQSYSGGDVGTNGNFTVTGSLGSSGPITAANLVVAEGGGDNIKGFLTPATAISFFNGAALSTNAATPSTNTWLFSLSGSAEVFANAYTADFSKDELISIKADINNGVKFADWSGAWLDIPAGGSPTFNRKTTINNVLALTPQDPLPSGNLGELAVSGSSLYFHNGTSWGVIS